MKLFDYETYEDYGKEWFFQVLTRRNFALFDFTLQWDDFGSDEIFPAIQVSIGSSHLFGFFFRWNRFQFDFSVIDFKRRSFEWYRENK